jgi:medium-chain acyl-[acyl-carrier-protein] hydrolase
MNAPPRANAFASPWFVPHSRGQAQGQRLFCFPYAGGNAYLFRPWVEALPAALEVVGIQAPGKGSRVLEPPCTGLRALAEQLAAALAPHLTDKPFCFFGHSNGALVAFELCCLLQARGLPLPRRLFLSASPAPWLRHEEKPYSQMSEAEFKTMLRDMNGTPAEVLDNPELYALMEPGLRADFALSENYRYAWDLPLDVPVSLFYGAHDAISEEQIFGWQAQLAQTPDFTRLDGGHFFIHSHQAELVALLRARLPQPAPFAAYA